MPVFRDAVSDTTTTTGTGTITLAGSTAVAGTRTISSAHSNADTLYYRIENSDNTEWEVGLGTYTSSGTTLSRDTILASSNSGSAVNFSAGTKNVFAVLAATAIDPLDLMTSSPGTPGANTVRLSRNTRGQWTVPQFTDPNGRTTGVQPGLVRGGRCGVVSPRGTSSGDMTCIGMLADTLGTRTQRTIANTNLFTSLVRIGSVSSASTGQSVGFRLNGGSGTGAWRGDTANMGGFLARYVFGVSDASFVSSTALFAGYCSTSFINNVDPSSLTNMVGMGFDPADTTMQIMHNDGSGTATKVDLGANFPANTTLTDVYELVLYAAPNGSAIQYYVNRANTGNTASGTLSTDLPTSSTQLVPYIYRGNRGVASAVGVDLFCFEEQLEWGRI